VNVRLVHDTVLMHTNMQDKASEKVRLILHFLQVVFCTGNNIYKRCLKHVVDEYQRSHAVAHVVTTVGQGSCAR
jgi:hypothetical protein